MNNNNHERYSTYLRTLYSPGFSAILLSYYKIHLSLLFQPFERTDPRAGMDVYSKRGIMTTVNYAGAFGLWKSCYDIIHGNAETLAVTIHCARNATLTLEKRAPGEVFLTISKDSEIISHKFASLTTKVKGVNGVETIEVIEAGLGAFMKTVDGYLVSINADGHLNKLGDDLEKYQEADQQAHNATGNTNHGNGGQFGNNMNYQTPHN